MSILVPSLVNQPLIEPLNQPSNESWRWPWKDPVHEQLLKELWKGALDVQGGGAGGLYMRTSLALTSPSWIEACVVPCCEVPCKVPRLEGQAVTDSVLEVLEVLWAWVEVLEVPSIQLV